MVPNTLIPAHQADVTSWVDWARSWGIKATSEGLIIPDEQEYQTGRIREDIFSLTVSISSACWHGKTVLYLPGSYDLVHVGHLAYLEQVIGQCLGSEEFISSGKTREDIYVVMLADDDDLVAQTKAHKHFSCGGVEIMRRPIEYGVDKDGLSPRIKALASLPVDCVGFIPSYKEDNLPRPIEIDAGLAHKLAFEMGCGQSLAEFLRVLDEYMLMADYFDANGHFGQGEIIWNIAAWQLYFNLQLTDRNLPGWWHGDRKVKEPFSRTSITRVVSAYHTNYLEAARFICKLAEMLVFEICDHQITSTTKLLERHLPDELLASKGR